MSQTAYQLESLIRAAKAGARENVRQAQRDQNPSKWTRAKHYEEAFEIVLRAIGGRLGRLESWAKFGPPRGRRVDVLLEGGTVGAAMVPPDCSDVRGWLDRERKTLSDREIIQVTDSETGEVLYTRPSVKYYSLYYTNGDSENIGVSPGLKDVVEELLKIRRKDALTVGRIIDDLSGVTIAQLYEGHSETPIQVLSSSLPSALKKASAIFPDRVVRLEKYYEEYRR